MATALFAGRLHAQTNLVSARPSASTLSAFVDRYFNPIVDNHDFAGAVLIARGDDILVHRAYGIADPELGVKSSVDFRYRIASLTKTFTAAAVVMLAERGQLRFDDKLSRFLPEFPGADGITILHLLRHEAGLDNPDYRDAMKERIDLVELVRRIGARPPLFRPGTQGRYSNAGYSVLALVIEKVSGMSYDEFLQKNIFLPLGMTATGNFHDDTIISGRVRGYIPGPPLSGVVPTPWSDIGFMVGSGSITSTTGDLFRWARAVHTESLFRRSALPYPYGWGRLGQDRRSGIEQTGLGNGFTASLAVWFSDSLYIVVLGNVESARWAQWSTDLAALARGTSVPITDRRHEIPLTATRADRFVGNYVTSEHSIVIKRHANSLWLLLDGFPVPKYLAPISANEFELRSDFGRIVFDTTGTGESQRLTWVFSPNERTIYPRRLTQ